MTVNITATVLDGVTVSTTTQTENATNVINDSAGGGNDGGGDEDDNNAWGL